MSFLAAPRALPPSARRALRIMLVAKHVHWEEGAHPSDGTHAVYHREMRSTLEEIGVTLHLADSYETLFQRPPADFVFPLLNRGGFLNSEMLLPLLCERQGLPYLGASPILRGLADDKLSPSASPPRAACRPRPGASIGAAPPSIPRSARPRRAM